jgi:hypothetical protein
MNDFDAINERMVEAARACLALGARLAEVKARVGEGEFARLIASFGWQQKTADRYLDAAATWADPFNLKVEASIVLSRINRPHTSHLFEPASPPPQPERPAKQPAKRAPRAAKPPAPATQGEMF